MRVRPASAALLCALVLPPPVAAYPAAPEPIRNADLSGFAVPLRGPLHERFGYARGRLHSGLDIAVLRTDAVRAALPGVVTATGYVRNYSGYGLVIRIRHPNRITTLYAHLASARVRKGERVERAQLIARAGCTGSCTGPHLHFEVRVRGRLVDPLRYLKGRVR